METQTVIKVFLVSKVSRMDIKQNLLDKAEGLFHRFGVRSISMDEIAREVNMSKKTVYQYFKDKDEIVNLVSKQHIEREVKQFNEVFDTSEDSIDEMIKLSTCFRNTLSGMNPSLLFDLQKYHPNSWAQWLEFKNEHIKNSIKRNIERGKDEGYYRQNLDPECLAIFRVEQIEMTFDNSIFPQDKFNFTEVQMMLFDHFVHGLLTQRGQEIYDDLTKSNINE